MDYARTALSPLLAAPFTAFGAGLLQRSLLELAFGRVVAAIHRRHPGISERLADHGEPSFLIDATELPFLILLRFRRTRPALTLHPKHAPAAGTAAIRGPLAALMLLLEGKLDGDALFFSRVISFEGDTSALLALRNAIESSEIALIPDLIESLGPLRGPARRMVGQVSRLLQRGSRDFEALRRAIIGPLDQRIAQHAAQIAALQSDVALLTCAGNQARRTPRATAGTDLP